MALVRTQVVLRYTEGCVCVCQRERGREGERNTHRHTHSERGRDRVGENEFADTKLVRSDRYGVFEQSLAEALDRREVISHLSKYSFSFSLPKTGLLCAALAVPKLALLTKPA